MKRILLILAILLTALTCLDAQKTKQNYVIGFYNLENLWKDGTPVSLAELGVEDADKQ